jgi:choline kinase
MILTFREKFINSQMFSHLMKDKIAISMDKDLLELIDSKIDNVTIRSRSQAIEIFVRKGLGFETIETAVIMIKGDQQELVMQNKTSLITKQIQHLEKFGIDSVIILTQPSKRISEFEAHMKTVSNSAIIKIIDLKGNAKSLYAIKDLLKTNFVVVSGDVFNEFDLKKMIQKHKNQDKLVTLGLMTVKDLHRNYGLVKLDGDAVISFEEREKVPPNSIVNAGTYIFKPEIFHLFNSETVSLEREIFPKISGIGQMIGFFTMGEYVHLK